MVTEEEWEDHTDAIERAQKHIIAISGKEVARDVVQVKVEGPTCEDLTLVGLPGIVRALVWEKMKARVWCKISKL